MISKEVKSNLVFRPPVNLMEKSLLLVRESATVIVVVVVVVLRK